MASSVAQIVTRPRWRPTRPNRVVQCLLLSRVPRPVTFCALGGRCGLCRCSWRRRLRRLSRCGRVWRGGPPSVASVSAAVSRRVAPPRAAQRDFSAFVPPISPLKGAVTPFAAQIVTLASSSPDVCAATVEGGLVATAHPRGSASVTLCAPGGRTGSNRRCGTGLVRGLSRGARSGAVSGPPRLVFVWDVRVVGVSLPPSRCCLVPPT